MVQLSGVSSPVVLVDDESTVLLSSEMILASSGIKSVVTVQDSRTLMPLLANREVAVVVLDLFMPHLSGTRLLPEIVKNHPDLPVIIMTANQDIETAVACMKDGAFDYVVKPVEVSRFVSSIKRALELRALRQQMGALKHSLMTDSLENSEAFSSIVTTSRKMRALFQYLEAIADSNESVLITGESGTGKELLADAVHRLSNRPGEFVPVNVAGLDDNLFSDTLFGHRRGAFSGAVSARDGMVTRAAGGTLFLDEIGDLSHASQVKLLRLLQERQYYPLGSDVAKMSDARILCATNCDLNTRMTEGDFRSDLFFRLRVHQVDIPSLRERAEDIPILSDFFTNQACEALGKKPASPSAELLTLLTHYRFPGNVRELRSMLYDAVARHKSGSVLAAKTIRASIKEQLSAVPDTGGDKESPSAEASFPTLKEAERRHIEEALRRSAGNQGTAAALLGISRPALNRRLSRMNKGDRRREKS